MKYKYLKTHRIKDIITLIQLLSFSPKDSLNINKDKDKLPHLKSSNELRRVANDHPEFFLVDNEELYLSVRYQTRTKLTLDQAIDLIQIANSLHDKELAQRNKNIIYVPIFVSILSAIIAIITLYNSQKKFETMLHDTISDIYQNSKSEKNIATDTLIYNNPKSHN